MAITANDDDGDWDGDGGDVDDVAGNRERVLTLVFDTLKQRRMASHSMMLAVASTWPQLLNRSGHFCLLNSSVQCLLYCGHWSWWEMFTQDCSKEFGNRPYCRQTASHWEIPDIESWSIRTVWSKWLVAAFEAIWYRPKVPFPMLISGPLS